MLDKIIQKVISKQKPYYELVGKPIQGINNQYWLVFKSKVENPTLVSVLMEKLTGNQNTSLNRVIRIDTQTGKVYTYIPSREMDLPSQTLLRTSDIQLIEKFFDEKETQSEIEEELIEGSFLELETKGKRRYNLPQELEKYNAFFQKILSRAAIYRRSTGYFESGVLKVYQEPLQEVIRSDGKVRLLVDWLGFTNKRDLDELEKLQDSTYRSQHIAESIEAFLQGLDEKQFTSTEIMAELIRLGYLEIRMVRMNDEFSIYHKKTGIFTDHLGHHIQHEGSDNFTRAAHSRNAESVTFLYSIDSRDSETIKQSIQEFDGEWNDNKLTHSINQPFLELVKKERHRRDTLYTPRIDSITPSSFKPGETTPVKIKGSNLDQIDSIDVEGNELINVEIEEKTQDLIKAGVTVEPGHPSRPIRLRISKGNKKIPVELKKEPQVKSKTDLEDYGEIIGFKEAVEKLIQGEHGTPKDFLFWLASLRPNQFKIETSDTLDDLVDDGSLFEHQKSGALHCLRVINDFGVAVCADAVGLGKTRLAAAVAKIANKPKIAIIAAKKLHYNWMKEMLAVGLSHEKGDFELYNKNLMGLKGSNFLEDFSRFGGPDLIIIDEAHEGIRNFNNRIHKACLMIKDRDRRKGKERSYLLLTATPWNNRREDIYNILSPFITHPDGFKDIGLDQAANYFENRENIELFTDNTPLFRRVYKELFLQRTRSMLKEAYPSLNLYAKRVAKWLPVQFEPATERALDRIFQRFETDLKIPFAQPIRYFSESVEAYALPGNMRRFFLQRAESSMYALKRTISNFQYKLKELERTLLETDPTPEGLEVFLYKHYKVKRHKTGKTSQQEEFRLFDNDDDDFLEQDEDEDEIREDEREARLVEMISTAIEALRDKPERIHEIRNTLLVDCERDLESLEDIKGLLSAEFVKDHKREEVTKKVRALVQAGEKVLLISTFSDSVLDYYQHMIQDPVINAKGIGLAIGGSKVYYPDHGKPIPFAPNNATKAGKPQETLKREELFKIFAPVATARSPEEIPPPEKQLSVLIGSETLSVGQNLQDADILINIDLPWNPMVLEQRIGRIDRPKKHKVQELQIFYANSESQLLRQASRLERLHQKLIGESTPENIVPRPDSIEQRAPFSADDLGASIYGDTFFDDEVLPDYINFINMLRESRQVEQESLQEKAYEKQDVSKDIFTHLELLYGEDVSRLLREWGSDYEPNKVSLGRKTGREDEPNAVLGLKVERFGPNGESIEQYDLPSIFLWNDLTGEKGVFGQAIKYGIETPEATGVYSSEHIKKSVDELYQKLRQYKQTLEEREVSSDENWADLSKSSDRLNAIVSRITKMQSLPEGIAKERIKDSVSKLAAWKSRKPVQKVLRELAGPGYRAVSDEEYVLKFLDLVEAKNLMPQTNIKTASVRISLEAILLRA